MVPPIEANVVRPFVTEKRIVFRLSLLLFLICRSPALRSGSLAKGQPGCPEHALLEGGKRCFVGSREYGKQEVAAINNGGYGKDRNAGNQFGA